MTILRLNHAVLYVRDAQRTAQFFADLLGFVVTHSVPGGVFMKCSEGSRNDHDLAFFSIGADAGDSEAGTSQVGMYHLAWEVETLRQLSELRSKMSEAGALVGASDHGVSKSLYCKDPDGLEFELMWAVPPEKLDPSIDATGIAPLNIDRVIRRFGADTPGHITS